MSYSTKNIAELKGLRDKIPLVDGFIPIILKASTKETPKLNTDLFICNMNGSASILFKHLRTKIKLSPEQGLYLFINNQIINGNSRISMLYKQYQQEGFLIIDYALENCFGEN